MANPEDLERLRKEGDKAQDYFSKIPGFEQAQWRPNTPPPAAPAEEAAPAAPAKPEPPLSEAEKYFKKLLG